MSKPISDIDGNELPPPPPDSDLALLERILLFARRNDFQVGPLVRVGAITVQVRDLRQKTGGTDGVPNVDFWEAAGHHESERGG